MYYFRLLIFIGAVFLVVVPDVFAFQGSLGSPNIRNITPEEYQGRVQNWHAAQASSGILYIANLGGVLEYDGEHWQAIDLPNTTALSIGIYQDTVFVGGVDEIGYLYAPSRDSAHTRYRSLTDRLPEGISDFGDVWQALSTENGIFFRTGKYLFRYKNGKFDHWKAETGFHFAFNVRGELYINVREKGLHKLVGNQLRLVEKGEAFAEDGIYAMLPFGEGRILIATRFKNLVIYDGNAIRDFKSEANPFLENNTLYNGIKLSDGSFVFGTIQGGIVRIDRQGQVLDIINKEMGMLTDVVYHLFEDREKNLWVSQNEGLSVIDILSPVKTLDERHGLEGMARAMIADDEQFLVGTTKGLYQRNGEGFGSPLFNKLDDFTDMPNHFMRFKNQLFFTATEGFYEIKGEELNQVLPQRYSTGITPSSQYPGFFFLSARDGLHIIKKEGERFTKVGKVEGINSEVNSVAEDSAGNVWAAVYTKGIYQLSWDGAEQSILNPTVRLKAADKKRPHVYKIGNEVFFGFEQSFMKYNSQLDSPVENVSVETDYFEDTNPGVFLMAASLDKDYWLRSGQFNIEAVREENNFIEQPSNLYLIESNQYNFIYPDAQGMVWFGTEEGLIRYDPSSSYEYNVDYQSIVREVKVHNDSLIYSGPRNNPKQFTLTYAENELRFQYAAPTFVRKDDVEYQVCLEGFDSKWSNWTSETQKDYTNIPEGDYTFKVRARNIHNKISRAGTFNFTVLPPWYRTIWAYGLYLIVIGGVLYGIHRIRINRILREQRIRNRIASDLHDEVSATLSSITYFAEAISQTKNGNKSERFVGLISESASEAKEKITDIIWSIDPDKDDWVNLLSKCRRFASDLFESKDMDYELDIDTDIARPLDIELRQQLWLIFKELVINAARHSQARKVEIRFGMEDNILRLVVQDNGKGIDEERLPKLGHGIKNIRKRARDIGAEIQLETDGAIGTRWIMTLKV